MYTLGNSWYWNVYNFEVIQWVQIQICEGIRFYKLKLNLYNTNFIRNYFKSLAYLLTFQKNSTCLLLKLEHIFNFFFEDFNSNFDFNNTLILMPFPINFFANIWNYMHGLNSLMFILIFDFVLIQKHLHHVLWRGLLHNQP